MNVKEVIKLNTHDLLEGYKNNKITVVELIDLEKQAVLDDEFEVAISVKSVLQYIKNFKNE